MNPFLETWLVAARDCRKNVRSAKGIVMLVISLLGALACTLKLPKFEEALDDVHKLDAEQLRQIKLQMFSKLYGDDATGETLAGAPIKLVILFFVAVWLAPLLVMIVGFDGISSDLQYRSVRYWTIRTRRPSYYAGKFLALWIIIGALTLFMQLVIWGVTVARADAPINETFVWGLRFWVTSLPITGAWCGVATLMSSLVKSPMLSLLFTGATFFAMFLVGYVGGKGWDVNYLRFFYPNNFDAWLLSPKYDRLAEGVGVCLAYIVGTCGIGSYVLMQRDV